MTNNYKHNIERVYASAPESIRRAGTTWYKDAHATAKAWAARYDLPLPAVCGCISALSPGMAWELNMELAEQFCKLAGTGKARRITLEIPESAFKRGYRRNARKAWHIITGKLDPHAAFATGTAQKTKAFFLNILNPVRSREVTVDRHAYCLAIGLRASYGARVSKRDYATIERCYQSVADRYNVAPHVVQAVTWVWHRNRYQDSLFH